MLIESELTTKLEKLEGGTVVVLNTIMYPLPPYTTRVVFVHCVMFVPNPNSETAPLRATGWTEKKAMDEPSRGKNGSGSVVYRRDVCKRPRSARHANKVRKTLLPDIRVTLL